MNSSLSPLSNTPVTDVEAVDLVLLRELLLNTSVNLQQQMVKYGLRFCHLMLHVVLPKLYLTKFQVLKKI